MNIDANAPIEPYIGIGGIKLYSTMDELNNVLSLPETKKMKIAKYWVRYDIGNLVTLFFHTKNKKLFKICTQSDYKGKLFNLIGVGTNIQTMIQCDSELTYDEFEEIWESPKGYFIETDVDTDCATWISVFIKELNDDNFDNACW